MCSNQEMKGSLSRERKQYAQTEVCNDKTFCLPSVCVCVCVCVYKKGKRKSIQMINEV